jgi:glyoxylase-like metal-dependent hydrolase (beta-lactamase superfamily II)
MTDRTYISAKPDETEADVLQSLRGRHGLHLFRLPTPVPSLKVNIYFLDRPVPTLIDAPADAPQFLEELENGLSCLGYSLRDIKVIIITHPHFDHYGSAASIAEMSGAAIWASGETGEWMANFEEECAEEERFTAESLERAGVPSQLMDPARQYFRFMKGFARGVRPVRILRQGEVLDLGSFHLTVESVPGHTPWCVMLHDREERIAFTGDFLLEGISPNPLIQRSRKVPGGYKSLQAYATSLERVNQMNLRLALPGHGRLIRNPSERIEGLLNLIEKRRQAIIARFSGGSNRTIFDIVSEIFPDLPDEQMFLAVSEISAHIEVLEGEGILKKTGESPDLYALA